MKTQTKAWKIRGQERVHVRELSAACWSHPHQFTSLSVEAPPRLPLQGVVTVAAAAAAATAAAAAPLFGVGNPKPSFTTTIYLPLLRSLPLLARGHEMKRVLSLAPFKRPAVCSPQNLLSPSASVTVTDLTSEAFSISSSVMVGDPPAHWAGKHGVEEAALVLRW
ncbi:hypothetical protein MUK42_36411 [Musa troglodytarum]|uniref:Uncharacterized protein n=1 Tax=Musa troglodytarum TaxID=320322 RepID=A0A9E7EJY0_9LILI|nr:hypothetical protein MUK42_36411 [Musa troglodytarum]